MTGGLGVGAIVTVRGDKRRDWWTVTGYDDQPGVGRRLHLSRWVPDAWVRVRAGDPWWEYTVVFPAVSPWPVGVS